MTDDTRNRSSDLEEDFWLTEPGLVLNHLEDNCWLMQRTHETGTAKYRAAIRWISEYFPWALDSMKTFTEPFVCPRGCGGDYECWAEQVRNDRAWFELQGLL